MAEPDLDESPSKGTPQKHAIGSFYGTPAGRALKFETAPRALDRASILLPWVATTSQLDKERVHPGAILVAADQCLGMAVSGDRPRHLVTLELRIDWFGPVPVRSSIRCDAQSMTSAHRAHYVKGEIRAGEAGPIIARASGQFLVGASAGGFRNSEATPNIETVQADWSSFDAFLGLRQDGNSLVLDPGWHRIGSAYLPALHGGVTAASLQQAMIYAAEKWQPTRAIALISTTVQFLNAGAAREPLVINTEWVREGRTAGLLSATATQAGSPAPIAVAQATFLAIEGAAVPRTW